MREDSIVGLVSAVNGQSIHLLAGQVYVGTRATSVRTLLGSCVAVTLWNPQRRAGGMCHFLLPSRQRKADEAPDARFGEESLAWMLQALARQGLSPQSCEAHLYGGADTMPETSAVRFNVGERNIEMGWSMIERCGAALQGVDVGDHVPRQVSMDLRTGEVICKRGMTMRRAA